MQRACLLPSEFYAMARTYVAETGDISSRSNVAQRKSRRQHRPRGQSGAFWLVSAVEGEARFFALAAGVMSGRFWGTVPQQTDRD